ncbi:putative vacuolar membrane protein [Exophiala dermatitidis]
MVDTNAQSSLQPGVRREQIEMDDSALPRTPSRQRLLTSQARNLKEEEEAPPQARLVGMARHTLGLILLLCVVFLWTLSNFLGSSIFADNTYAKPFFLTYLNTSMFMLAMIPTLMKSASRNRRKQRSWYRSIRSAWSKKGSYTPLRLDQHSSSGSGTPLDLEDPESERFLKSRPDRRASTEGLDGDQRQEQDDYLEGDLEQEPAVEIEEDEVAEKDKELGIVPTARLSLAFCFLWFGANYFAMACLQHTTVASTTILTSTSSFWTLLIGALTGMERFTWRKLCGVLGSLVGIILISRVDLTKSASHATTVVDRFAAAIRIRSPDDEDQFPDKPPSELALGDALALLSAIIYGVYTITLKKSTIKALPRSLNMPLFFGLVGTFNLVLLFPLFPILHYTGLERFELPPTPHVWTILLTNSISSFFSDICWAYAMVLTSPLLVTVGLSLTIPLSLIGEMVLQGHYEGWLYWVGALVVVGSFVFVDHEEREEEAEHEHEHERDHQNDHSAAGSLLGHGHPDAAGPNRGRHHVTTTTTTTTTTGSNGMWSDDNGTLDGVGGVLSATDASTGAGGGMPGADSHARANKGSASSSDAQQHAITGPGTSDISAPTTTTHPGETRHHKKQKKHNSRTKSWNRLLSGGGAGGGWVSSDDDDDDDFLHSCDSN